MTKYFAKAILKSVKLEGEEYYTADEHELVVNFASVQNLDAMAESLERLGIPREKMRIALIVATDEPVYDNTEENQ